MRSFNGGPDRGNKLVRARGLKGGTFGPAGPCVSTITGEIFKPDPEEAPARRPRRSVVQEAKSDFTAELLRGLGRTRDKVLWEVVRASTSTPEERRLANLVLAQRHHDRKKRKAPKD